MFSSSATGLTGAEMQQAAWQVKQHCDGQTIQFFPMQDYKNLLVVKQGKKAMQTLNTKAPHENLQRPLQAFYPSGGEVAAALQLFIIESRRYLAELWKDKPYEYWLIPWGQSCVQPVPTLQELFHCAGAVICGTEIVKGIGVLMGMTVPPLRGATADVDTNLSEKVAAALAYGKDYPLVLLHVNGADEAGHRKNQQEKQNFLRQIDQKIVAVLQQRLQPGDRLLICSDHGTNAKTGQHEGSPQPFLLYEKEGKQRGYLGCLDGKLAVPLLSGEACKSIRRIG